MTRTGPRRCTRASATSRSTCASSSRGCSALVQGLEHNVVVRLRRDLGEVMGDLAVAVDYEGGAQVAPVLAPVHRLLGPDPVGLGDGVLGVAEQREREAVLV